MKIFDCIAYQKLLDGLASKGGNIAVLFVLVLVVFFVRLPSQEHIIDLTLGGLLGILTGNAINRQPPDSHA